MIQNQFFFLRGVGGGGRVVFHTKAQHFYSGQYMRVMICLGQGGLRSLSASSVFGVVGLSVCLSVCLWTTLLKKL